jgi:hypothetical protein
MNNLIRPASLLLYLLAVITCFLVGMYIAGITNAGEGQGLAGGAIVLWYGIIAAFAAFLFALIGAYFLTTRTIKIANLAIFIVFVLLISVLVFKVKNAESSLDEREKPVWTAQFAQISNSLNWPRKRFLENNLYIRAYTFGLQKVQCWMNLEKGSQDTGLGFFKPNMHQLKSLYFYTDLNFGKSHTDHTPFDSISFGYNAYENLEITYAPPCLLPTHNKTDYGILLFKVVSISSEFIEIEVNTTTGQTSWVSRFDGDILYWPGFLLTVNSVEFLPASDQSVRIKPLDYASTIDIPFVFMRPARIKAQWMLVELLDQELKPITQGWIQWMDGNKILIKYSLLS